MNENVKTKIPKRRRWVARLLVIALCILLASSLLFVSVVAENVNTLTHTSVDQSASDSKRFFGLHFSGDGYMGLTEVSINPSSNVYVYIYKYGSVDIYRSVTFTIPDITTFGYCSSSDEWIFVSYYSSSSSSIVAVFYSYDGIVLAREEKVLTSFYSFTYSVQINNYRVCGFYNNGQYLLYLSFKEVEDGDILYFTRSPFSSDDDGFVCGYGLFDDSQWKFYFSYDSAYYILSALSFELTSSSSFSVLSTRILYVGNVCYTSTSFSSLKQVVIVDNAYVTTSVSLPFSNKIAGVCLLDVIQPYFNDTLVGYQWGNSSLYYYPLYATSSEYVSPPESSDETTETPPPESSDETSVPGDIPEGYTKIWYSSLASDGSYSATVIGAIDLREAVEVRAYLGSWTSIDASFQSDIQVPLTIQVFNSDEGPPVVYTYDYYAAGYAVDSGIPDDFVFPDFIGDYVTLPYNGELNIYFADVSPSGTVLVSTPATWGGRVTLNLTSASSYFRLDFIDEDTFAVVVFNGDGPGSRVNFNFDIRAYREYYVASDGDKTSSRWFTPSFGTSVSYSSERVLNDGLYMVFVDSYNDTDYPWENGDWSSAIDDMNSRLDGISYDHALLESLANDAYGDFPFGSADKADFDAAISNFDTIKDSSGGDYILRYMSGLWTIHPFASSMVIIVGTFAIIGFIIRKL